MYSEMRAVSVSCLSSLSQTHLLALQNIHHRDGTGIELYRSAESLIKKKAETQKTLRKRPGSAQ